VFLWQLPRADASTSADRGLKQTGNSKPNQTETTPKRSCGHGQCVAKSTDCDVLLYNVRVSKYQQHHLYYLSAVANVTALTDDAMLWNGGTYPLPCEPACAARGRRGLGAGRLSRTASP
jgi:hypothetical protein